ncbi:penicillin-insensitive murein endopeptidase [Sorangium sp. So ce119]|uniref:penicillin-insensitive murein endopeptidase n=1 Tax=Sorangium sp. So ce119 TaxID=3133279 RepID=UPI003F63D7C6
MPAPATFAGYAVRGTDGARLRENDRATSYKEEVPTERAIERWARQRGFALDWKPSELPPTTATTTATAKPKDVRPSRPPRERHPEVNTPLPRNGVGYGTYQREARQFARQQVIDAIEKVGRLWAARHPDGPKFFVGDISQSGGGEFGHLSHREGVDVDIRYVHDDRPDGRGTITDRTYNRARTQELIDIILTESGLRVRYIFSDDTHLRGTRIARDKKGKLIRHHDHFHVRFVVP